MKHFFNISLIVISFLLMFCSTKQDRNENNKTKISNQKDSVISEKNSKNQIIETFVDSLNIGNKGQCKVELVRYGRQELRGKDIFDNIHNSIKFYTKKTDFWELKNEYTYEGTIANGFEPNISDFNNDGFNDITIISATAARGANQMRRLFIYDKQQNQLISILNSYEYPNMRFNKKLNCIDGFMIYGSGAATVFGRIIKDSIKAFASVENDINFHTVYEIDKNGVSKEISKIPNKNHDIEEVYIRHNNYKPLEKYSD